LGSSIQIQTTVLPNGIVDNSYYGLVTATGGCGPYTWTISPGKLPAGMSTKTSKNTGAFLIYGTPSKAASFTFTISAKPCSGTAAQKSYTVVIQKSPNHVVDLSWNPSTTKDVVGYNVYRGAAGKYWIKIHGLDSSTAYSDSAVANSTTYFYATTAVDVDGNESEKSNIVQTAIP
jgi:hypothetical protein